jgi:hypothetical protein
MERSPCRKQEANVNDAIADGLKNRTTAKAGGQRLGEIGKVKTGLEVMRTANGVLGGWSSPRTI